jgi:hypothetical protein
MRKLMPAGAIAFAIFGNFGFACAQSTPGSGHPELTASQQRMVSQGLAGSPSQPAPAGAQPQVGDTAPDSMTAQSVPSNVSNQVPAVKNLLFVKLPDRIILIDPDTKVVHEIVMNSSSDSATTGLNSNNSIHPSSNSSDRPQR